MLPTSGVGSGYNVTTSGSGEIIALTGSGQEIYNYISSKLVNAGSGDSIRINMYIIEHAYGRTSHIYESLAGALARGASIEIVTESNNLDINQAVSEARYRNTCEFLYGYPGVECPLFPGSTPRISPRGLKYEPVGQDGSINIYVCNQGCDSTAARAINHNKFFLLDINGERDIIVTSSNIRHGGATDWKVGIDLDGNHYTSQWNWWNSVFDADICFSQRGSNCFVGNGGYESNFEGNTVSYLPGPTPVYNAPADWLSKMQYEPGCALRVTMAHWSNSNFGRWFLDGLARVKSIGCEVDFLHSQVDEAEAISNYVNGRFKVEYQTNIHAQMILWQGVYDGAHESLAWVGSWNSTMNALRNNDESIVRIKSPSEFEAFWNFFSHIDEGFVPELKPEPGSEAICLVIKARSDEVITVCL